MCACKCHVKSPYFFQWSEKGYAPLQLYRWSVCEFRKDEWSPWSFYSELVMTRCWSMCVNSCWCICCLDNRIYTHVGQLCSVGVMTLGTRASAGINQGGSVEGTKSSSVRFLELACLMACGDLGSWDCGWQSVSGCDLGSFSWRQLLKEKRKSQATDTHLKSRNVKGKGENAFTEADPSG